MMKILTRLSAAAAVALFTAACVSVPIAPPVTADETGAPQGSADLCTGMMNVLSGQRLAQIAHYSDERARRIEALWDEYRALCLEAGEPESAE